jgi:hypothetical protein
MKKAGEYSPAFGLFMVVHFIDNPPPNIGRGFSPNLLHLICISPPRPSLFQSDIAGQCHPNLKYNYLPTFESAPGRKLPVLKQVHEEF